MMYATTRSAAMSAAAPTLIADLSSMGAVLNFANSF
jgi:hypothetical protein